MNPQSKYILFYSNNCIHSREFINQLYKNQPLYNKFIKVDVQNAKVTIPKCVNHVPAVIIRTPRMKPQVFIGDEVFHWYNQFLSRLQKSSGKVKEPAASSAMGSGTSSSIGSVLDYDPCAMSGFSDNFAFVDDKQAKTNPIEHQFEFLGGGSVGGLVGGMSMNGQPTDQDTDKSELEARMEDLMARRAMDTPQAPKREGGGP